MNEIEFLVSFHHTQYGFGPRIFLKFQSRKDVDTRFDNEPSQILNKLSLFGAADTEYPLLDGGIVYSWEFPVTDGYEALNKAWMLLSQLGLREIPCSIPAIQKWFCGFFVIAA